MADSTRRTYAPHSYRRICDTCGLLRDIEDIQIRPGDVTICTYDMNERTRLELAQASANMIPFRVRPVPNPKPQNPYYPNTLEADEAALLNFVAIQVANRSRYFDVTTGAGASLPGDSIPALSRAAIYLYGMISEASRPARFLVQARSLLDTCAAYLASRQQGFGLSPSSTRSTDAFYGGFYEPGASYWYGEDAATSGLALLRAYAVTGTTYYLAAARAAASFLRNLQAIGSDGTHYPSTDAAGTSRLYTGGITNQVANVAGFYSDSRFYPSSLIALEFWTALQTVDSDQLVGADAVVTGFSTIPEKLLSDAIEDMRAFWENGTLDVYSNAVITGLSDTTPREFFNAYPTVKANTTVTGTGSWEYQDGGAATGTTVTAFNFAQGVASLYAVEGASEQATVVDEWLRLFTSNETFETPDATSPETLAATSTGDYDPVQSLATLLLVRDSTNSYAATAKNASSLYDWASFGVLSRMWAARHTATFKLSRLYPLGVVRRWDYGVPQDAVYDRIPLRGQCGLSYQTSFTSSINGVARRVNDLVAAACFGANYRESRT